MTQNHHCSKESFYILEINIIYKFTNDSFCEMKNLLEDGTIMTSQIFYFNKLNY